MDRRPRQRSRSEKLLPSNVEVEASSLFAGDSASPPRSEMIILRRGPPASCRVETPGYRTSLREACVSTLTGPLPTGEAVRATRLKPATPAELRSEGRPNAPPSLHELCRTPTPDACYFVHWSTHAFTVSYHSLLFCGLSTQWPSSGK